MWNFFGFRKSNNEQKVILCKECRATVAGGGNTSNLFHHLKLKRAKQYYESQETHGTPAASKTKVAAAPLISKAPRMTKKSRRWREITEAIMTHICVGVATYLSTTICTGDGSQFRRRCHTSCGPNPLISLSVYSLCSPSCLCQFILSSSVMPPCVPQQCLLQCLPECLCVGMFDCCSLSFQYFVLCFCCYFVFCP